MEDKIIMALSRVDVDISKDSLNTPLIDYGLDSLSLVRLLPELEKEFNINIPADQFDEDHFINIQSIMTFLQKLGAH